MNYQLYHGDCLEVMPTLPDASVDAIISDLPYGTTALSWDSVIPFEPLWEQYKRLIKPRGAVVLFGSQPFTSALVMSNPEWFKWEDIWYKVRGTDWQLANIKPLKAHENILVFCDGKVTYNPQKTTRDKPRDRRGETFKAAWSSKHNQFASKQVTSQKIYYDRFPVSVIEINSQMAECNNVHKLHPTQKPVALLEYLIRTYTNPGDLVLDNVFGSCTTGIACLNTGRRFIGIELDPDYFKIGKERIDKRAAELRMEYVQPKATEPIDTLPLFQEAGQ